MTHLDPALVRVRVRVRVIASTMYCRTRRYRACASHPLAPTPKPLPTPATPSHPAQPAPAAAAPDAAAPPQVLRSPRQLGLQLARFLRMGDTAEQLASSFGRAVRPSSKAPPSADEHAYASSLQLQACDPQAIWDSSPAGPLGAGRAAPRAEADA